MTTVVAFLAAAALGAVVRAEAGRRWNRGDGIAVATIVVNVTGAFLLGLLTEVTGPAATVLGVGALGASTTFSGFAGDVVALAEARRFRRAAITVAATYGLGIAAAAAGVALAG